MTSLLPQQINLRPGRHMGALRLGPSGNSSIKQRPLRKELIHLRCLCTLFAYEHACERCPEEQKPCPAAAGRARPRPPALRPATARGRRRPGLCRVPRAVSPVPAQPVTPRPVCCAGCARGHRHSETISNGKNIDTLQSRRAFRYDVDKILLERLFLGGLSFLPFLNFLHICH